MKHKFLYLLICLFFFFAGSELKYVYGQEKKSSKERKEQPEIGVNPWQNSIQDFKLLIAQRMDSITDSIMQTIDTTKTHVFQDLGIEPLVTEYITKFQGKEVLWQITFKEMNDKGKIAFEEERTVKEKPRSTLDWINISIEPSQQHLDQWKALSSGQSVKCRAKIEYCMAGTRWSKNNRFAGWFPMIMLNEAESIISENKK